MKLKNKNGILILILMLFLGVSNFAGVNTSFNKDSNIQNKSPLKNAILTNPKTSGTDIAICTADNTQDFPQICPDGLGGAIFVWADNRSGAWKIYAQRTNSSGDVQWAPNGVFISDTTDNLIVIPRPQICSDGVGGAIIAWNNYTGVVNNDIYAQRINSNGEIQWNPQEGVAICTEASDQMNSLLISDGQGGAIIAWWDYRAIWRSLYVQRINSTGHVTWDNNGVPITVATVPMGFQMCSDGQGGAIIAWMDSRSFVGPGLTKYDLYAQRVDNNGTVRWITDGKAICNKPETIFDIHLCKDGLGGAFMVWSDNRSGTFDVYGQRVNSEGNAQWNTNGSVICSTNNDSRIDSVCYNGLGEAILAWRDERNFEEEIYTQKINSNGIPQWDDNGKLICSVQGEKGGLLSCSDGLGGSIITWTEEGGADDDIYAQYIDSNGVAKWTVNGRTICTENEDQFVYDICINRAGSVFITWEDRRNSNSDIYAQVISLIPVTSITNIIYYGDDDDDDDEDNFELNVLVIVIASIVSAGAAAVVTAVIIKKHVIRSPKQ